VKGTLGSDANTLLTYSNNTSIHSSAKYEPIRWLAKLAVYNNDFEKAKDYALSIPNSTLYAREILLDLAVEILERWGDIDKATIILGKLVEKFPDKETIAERDFILKIYSEYISRLGKELNNPYVIDNETSITSFDLFDAYPNPFNPTTSIQYQILSQNNSEKETFISLKVYDILGREVTTLVNEMKKPGIYTVNFNASDLASGIYIYRLQSDNFVSSKKMLLLK